MNFKKGELEMLNAIKVETQKGEQTFYLFKIHSMIAYERTEKVKSDFLAKLEYVCENSGQQQETPQKLIGITQLEDGSLLNVHVLEKVEALVKDAFCNKKPILAWVEKDQGANITTIEAVISLPEPTEAEHINYYKEAFDREKKRRDL